MAKRRPRPTRVSPEGSLPPDVTPIELSSLVGDGPRSRPGPADPPRDRLWLQLRSEIERLFECGECDLRHYLTNDRARRRRLEAERLARLEEHFAGDPRVTMAVRVVH